MAISKSQRGVEMYITIDGTRAKEYGHHQDETQHEHPEKTEVKYIESIAGANFSIVSKVSLPYTLKSSLEFQIQVDNTAMPTAPLFVSKGRMNRDWMRTTDGREDIDEDGRVWKKPFKFASVKLVDIHDNKRVKLDAQLAKHIGEIRVTVYRKQVLEQTYGHTGAKEKESNLEISEKAVKGQTLSHGTTYDEAVNEGSIKTFETRPTRGCRIPAAVFIFRYRSKDALQQQHIIPRVPSQDILNRFSEEELRRMARQHMLGKQEYKTEKVKKEASTDGQLSRKFTSDEEILTIDITGDEVVETRVSKKREAPIDLCDDDNEWCLA